MCDPVVDLAAVSVALCRYGFKSEGYPELGW